MAHRVFSTFLRQPTCPTLTSRSRWMKTWKVLLMRIQYMYAIFWSMCVLIVLLLKESAKKKRTLVSWDRTFSFNFLCRHFQHCFPLPLITIFKFRQEVSSVSKFCFPLNSNSTFLFVWEVGDSTILSFELEHKFKGSTSSVNDCRSSFIDLILVFQKKTSFS